MPGTGAFYQTNSVFYFPGKKLTLQIINLRGKYGKMHQIWVGCSVIKFYVASKIILSSHDKKNAVSILLLICLYLAQETVYFFE